MRDPSDCYPRPVTWGRGSRGGASYEGTWGPGSVGRLSYEASPPTGNPARSGCRGNRAACCRGNRTGRCRGNRTSRLYYRIGSPCLRTSR